MTKLLYTDIIHEMVDYKTVNELIKLGDKRLALEELDRLVSVIKKEYLFRLSTLEHDPNTTREDIITLTNDYDQALAYIEQCIDDIMNQ